MSLTQDNMVMPVSPMYGNNGGFGGFGGDWSAWIVLFLIFGMFNGGWGGMGGFGGNQLGYDFPWLLNGQNNINANTNNGFRDAMLNDGITSIRDGINGLSTQLCNCCGDMQMAIANGFAGVEQGANARQIANMQTAFGIQSQLAQASADNRLGIAGIGSDIAREACATRTTDTQNTQAILNAINGGIQSVKDQIFADRLDDEKRENANLRQQIAMKDLAASQVAQNAFIAQGFSNEVDQLYNRLNSCPVPTTPVFGRTPIFQCNNGGCGCNGGFYN